MPTAEKACFPIAPLNTNHQIRKAVHHLGLVAETPAELTMPRTFTMR
jgi:hypothetical protein